MCSLTTSVTKTALSSVFLLVVLACTHSKSNAEGAKEQKPPSLAAGSTDACAHDATTFRCVRYLRNYDADTITVQIPNTHPLIGEKISVRVGGIDAPEIKGKNACEKDAARAARGLVENLLKNAKRIDLKHVDRDKYFRILADVEIDGTDLKTVLFKNRLAYAYDGGTKRKMDWCQFRKPAMER